MAKRKKRRGQSLFAYFENLFRENPDWLDLKKNETILSRYRADHNLAEGAEINHRIKNALNNKKSLMKKARDEGSNGTPKGGKRGRRKGSKAAAPVVPSAPRTIASLRQLEVQIDDCVAAALTLDRTGLDHVIKLLRSARNEIVVKHTRGNGQ